MTCANHILTVGILEYQKSLWWIKTKMNRYNLLCLLKVYIKL